MQVKKLIEELQKFELDKEHQAALAEYEACIDENQYEQALIVLCKFFKYDTLVEKLTHLDALHNLYGHLVPQLGELREEIDYEIRPRFLVEFKGYTQEEAEQYVNELKAC